jgi:hypothetical protein
MEQRSGDAAKRLRAAGRQNHPADVQKAVDRLRGAADARPELRGTVDVALAVVEAARREVDDAVVRAELAEDLVKGVRPELDSVAKRAEDAERRLAERDEIDAAEDARKSRDAEAVAKAEAVRRGWTPTPEQVAQIRKMAGQVEDLRAAQAAQAAGVAKAVQILTCIHKAVKNEDGKSPVQCFKESGEWTVSDADDGVIAVCEKRSDAIQLVADLLAEELAETEKAEEQDEAYRPQDTTHRPEPWRRKRPADVEQPPEVTPGVSKVRKRKQSRIL